MGDLEEPAEVEANRLNLTTGATSANQAVCLIPSANDVMLTLTVE
jgi:hypothetical protein